MNVDRLYLPILLLVLLSQILLMVIVGDVYVNAHESDVLHSLQGALRLVDGERTHFDFATPLGVLSFAPIALLLKLGFGHGAAMSYAGVMVAAVFLPAIYWVGVSRLSGHIRWIWGGGIILLITASVFGGEAAYNSYSMYYNRWGWGATFIVLSLVIFENRQAEYSTVDGLILGCLLTFVALSKITFFATFFPIVVIALVINKKWKVIKTAAIVGFIFFSVVTYWGGGFEYWYAYLDDLIMARDANLRAQYGGFGGFVARPSMSASIILLLVGASYLSSIGQKKVGALSLIMLPAFIYSTYNNWGVEPKFLLFFALVIWVYGGEHRKFGLGLAAISIGMLLPTVLNLVTSNVRPLIYNKSEFQTVFAEDTSGALMFNDKRSSDRSEQNLISEDYVSILMADGAEFVFSNCSLVSGDFGQTLEIVAKLEKLNLDDGRAILVADTFNNYWLFGNFAKLKNGSIWQYDGSHGIENAELVVVPKCVNKLETRNAVLDALAHANIGLSLIADTELALVFETVK